jgi:predicted phage terminase large subunit-like protein
VTTQPLPPEASPVFDLGIERIEAEHLSRDLRLYAPEAWRVAQPNVPFVKNWHHDAFAEHLQAVSLGQIRFLWISVAPRHTKSWYVSVFWPTWHWTRWPGTQIVGASYGLDLAVRDAVFSRSIIVSPWYQARWGCACSETPHADWCTAFRMTSDQNVKEHYTNDRGGRRLSAGVEAGTTGHGGDILILDDPLDIKRADSESARANAIKYIDHVFLGRMNDPQKSKMVGIAQRTHNNDPAGHLFRESGLPIIQLTLPTEFDTKAFLDLAPSPIGFKDPRTEEKQLLWPARFNEEVIEQTKKTLGSYAYSAQHQQNPNPAEGGYLQRGYWWFLIPRGLAPQLRAQLMVPVRSKEGIEYPPAIELPELEEWLLSLDASFKDEAGQVRKGRPPDPISLGAWGRSGGWCFLLDRINHRADITQTIKDLQAFMERYPKAVKKLIEDKANGPAIISMLRRRVGGLIPVTPQGGKVSRVMTAGATDKERDARAMSMVALLEAHNVFLPHPVLAPWVWEYIEEHAAFPNGTHDDDVDMTSQALSAMQPWIWREAGKAQNETLDHKGLPPVTDTRELLRRKIAAASGVDRSRKGGTIVDPYRRR